MAFALPTWRIRAKLAPIDRFGSACKTCCLRHAAIPASNQKKRASLVISIGLPGRLKRGLQSPRKRKV